jgi:hypothetical protein
MVNEKKERTYKNRIPLTDEWKNVINDIAAGMGERKACEKHGQSYTALNNYKKAQNTEWKRYYIEKVGAEGIAGARERRKTPTADELIAQSARLVKKFLDADGNIDEKQANFALKVITALKSGVRIPESSKDDDPQSDNFDSRIERTAKELNCSEEEAVKHLLGT